MTTNTRLATHIEDDADAVFVDRYIDEPDRFQAVIGSLTTRARTVVHQSRVRDISGFLSIGGGHLLSLKGCGVNIAQEILATRDIVAILILQSARIDQQVTSRQLTDWLAGRSSDSLTVAKWAHARHSSLSRATPPDIPVLAVLGHHRTHRASAVGLPAEQSILRMTIPALFLCARTQPLWERASEEALGEIVKLPEDEWRLLDAKGVHKNDRCDVLLSMTLGYLLNIGVSTDALDAFVAAVAMLIRCVDGSAHGPSSEAACAQPIFGDREMALLRNFRLDSFGMPESLLAAIVNRKTQTWGDLATISERNVFSLSGLSVETLSRLRNLWHIHGYFRRASEGLTGLPLEAFASFGSMIEAFVDMVDGKPREKTVALGLMGCLEGRRWLLGELGSRLGISRERVRQIGKKRLNALASPLVAPALNRFWIAVTETLRISGGICSVGKLSERVAAVFEWEEKPDTRALESVLRLCVDLRVDKNAGTVCDPKVRCLHCNAAASWLESLFEKDHRTELGFADVVRHVVSRCKRKVDCLSYSESLSPTLDFARFLVSKIPTVVVDKEVVCHRDSPAARPGSRVRLVEELIRQAGRPMSLRDVLLEVRRVRPGDRTTERGIYALISESKDIVPLGGDVFRHQAFADAPLELVRKVESWLSEQLNGDVPCVSVVEAFDEFQNDCSSFGVASEVALYYWLRCSAASQLHFSRFPNVCLADSPEPRTETRRRVGNAGRTTRGARPINTALQEPGRLTVVHCGDVAIPKCEIRAARLIFSGMSHKEAAESLLLGTSEIDACMARLRAKLGVKNKLELFTRLREFGIVR